MRVKDNTPAGTNLYFPATLSYVDPSGQPQSVNANISAQVWTEPVVITTVPLGAAVYFTDLLPENLIGWLFLIILILLIVLIVRRLLMTRTLV